MLRQCVKEFQDALTESSPASKDRIAVINIIGRVGIRCVAHDDA